MNFFLQAFHLWRHTFSFELFLRSNIERHCAEEPRNVLGMVLQLLLVGVCGFRSVLTFFHRPLLRPPFAHGVQVFGKERKSREFNDGPVESELFFALANKLLSVLSSGEPLEGLPPAYTELEF